jgi:tRNA pseudouridine13 synthase
VKEGHPSEKPFGMEMYSTDSNGVGGKLKVRYEDFLVEEVAVDRTVIMFQEWREEPVKETAIAGRKARYVLFTVQKMGISTMDVSNILASALRLSRNQVSYAGLKDKRAVTVQQMSIPSSALSSLMSVHLSRIDLRDFSYSKSPLQIGDLWGNRFTVFVRDLDVDGESAVEEAQTVRTTPLLNYFGVQRFGLLRSNTHLVGKSLIKQDFENAVRIMLCTESSFESDELKETRQALAEQLMPTSRMIESFPKELDYERIILHELLKHPGEFERALQRISPRILTLMVHAYQSYLFNRLLSERAKAGISIIEPEPGDFLIELNKAHSGRDSWLYVTEASLEERTGQTRRGEYGLALPVPGYATRLPPARQTDSLKALLEQEDITLSDFRNPGTRALDSPGGFHLSSILLDDLAVSHSTEGLSVKFSLRKGSYATVVLREIMKNHPINRI